MREILFRGNLVSADEWAFGCLKIYPDKSTAIITPDDTVLGKYGQVDPDTVGQYTGLTDTNQVKIFEGDICDFCVFDCFGDNTQHRAVVVYEEDRFVLKMASGETIDLAWTRRQDDEFQIVGNIHKNPELLEVTK